MRLEQLIYFIAIIRCRSINKAAKELYLSQPSLSKAVEATEQELDCKLFLRTSRGIIPTEEGLRVYEDACTITKIIDSWKDFPVFDRESQGEVRLIGTATFCDFLANGFVLEMKSKYPNLDIILQDGRRSEIIGKMLADDVKLGVASFITEEEIDLESFGYFDQITQKQNWEVELLLKDPRRVLVSGENPLAGRESVALGELKALPLAAYSNRDDEMAALYQKYFDEGTQYRLHNRGSIFRFVAEDRAATIFPTITTSNDRYLSEGLIRPVEVRGLDLPDARFFLVHQRTRFLKKAERAVMQELKNLCKEISVRKGERE